jgi:hypothetical protein
MRVAQVVWVKGVASREALESEFLLIAKDWKKRLEFQ